MEEGGGREGGGGGMAGKVEGVEGEDSRSIFVAPIEDQEWVRLAEEILLVQLVPTELHQNRLLHADKKKDRATHRYHLHLAEPFI